MKPLTGSDPQRIGDYWLAGRLGAGGQGVVYDAYHDDGRRVALKVLHAADRDRLEREATAARRVASFCTARVLDVELTGDKPYIVSEYVPGPSLRSAGKIFAGDDLDRLATAIVTALTAIHEAGVVHRDLKPDNVLLGPDGPRVIDFGVASLIDMSTTGGVAGTPTYMPPEVFTGQRAGMAGDVFAWGAIMVFAATGQDPFRADNLGSVLHRVLSSHPDLRAMPPRLRPLVEAALDKDPAARPAARDLLLALVSGDGSDTRGLLRQGGRAAGGLHVTHEADPALGTLAEDAYGTLGPEERELAAAVFLRLVSVTEDGQETGRCAALGELFDGRTEQEAAAVARILRVFSYVVAERDGAVALSRPALLRAWPRLRLWVDAERAGLAVLTKINTAARRWDAHGRKDADLPQGTQLEQALTWAATGRRHVTLTPLERDYLRAGTELTRRRGRRRTLTIAALAGLLVVALVAGGLAVQRGQETARQRDEATARRVALEANGMRAADPVAAMLLSVAAWRLHDDVDTRGSLALARWQREVAVFDDSWADPQETWAIGGGGRAVALVGPSGVRLLDPRDGRRIGGWASQEFRLVTIHSASLNRTGRLLAVVTNQSMTVWDTRTGRRIREMRDPELYLGIGTFSFTEQESTLAYSFSARKTVHLWDVVRNRRSEQAAQDCAVSPDGTTRACADKEGGLRLYDVANGKRRAEGEWQPVTARPALRFSPDGSHVAGFTGRTVLAWRVTDQRQVLEYKADSDVVDVRADKDGHTLWVLAEDGLLALDLRPVEPVSSVGERGTDTVLSPDGRVAAVLDEDRPVTLWDVRAHRLVARLGTRDTSAAFDPAGRTLVTGGRTLQGWDVATGRRLWNVPLNLDLSPGAVTFSPDGTRVAIGQTPYGDQVPGMPASGELLVVDARTGAKIMTSASLTDNAVFSADGRRLFTADGETIDLGTGRRTPVAMRARTMSHDGTIAADIPYGRVQLWRDGRLQRTLLRGDREAGLVRMVFDAAGRLLAAAGDGGTVQVWDVAARRRMGGAFLLRGADITSLAFAGSSLYVADAAGRIFEITVDPGRMAAATCARAGRTLTRAEWEQHFEGLPYRNVCPNKA
ncbi:protein kinase [Nonomuraea sp. NPDC050383]|uniref:protein kinase domain-containing protein n=1 Tax=Nonomuraea sp. NPDC050383 TaxID=3364362 RepID=UPI0037AB949C